MLPTIISTAGFCIRGEKSCHISLETVSFAKSVVELRALEFLVSMTVGLIPAQTNL